jgi:hypothetical protein
MLVILIALFNLATSGSTHKPAASTPPPYRVIHLAPAPNQKAESLDPAPGWPYAGWN